MSQYENSTTVAEQRQRILRLEVRNSALAADNKALKSEVAALRAEVEGMREDAERWRVIMDSYALDTGSYRFFVVSNRTPPLMPFETAEELIQTADAVRKGSSNG